MNALEKILKPKYNDMVSYKRKENSLCDYRPNSTQS